MVYARLEGGAAVDDEPYLDEAFVVGGVGGPFEARHLEQVSSDVAVAQIASTIKGSNCKTHKYDW